jgi:hypothetical protein
VPPPQTGVRLNGFTVDFFWPDLGLVVETDGLRDQAHAVSGLTPLRFTHEQVAYEPDHVRGVLGAVALKLSRPSDE